MSESNDTARTDTGGTGTTGTAGTTGTTDGPPPGGIERWGIPHPLRWGFVGVLIFMIGDGVEVSYLTDYLQQPDGGGLSGAQASFYTAKPRMRGSAAGWFWFAFTGGLRSCPRWSRSRTRGRPSRSSTPVPGALPCSAR